MSFIPPPQTSFRLMALTTLLKSIADTQLWPIGINSNFYLKKKLTANNAGTEKLDRLGWRSREVGQKVHQNILLISLVISPQWARDIMPYLERLTNTVSSSPGRSQWSSYTRVTQYYWSTNTVETSRFGYGNSACLLILTVSTFQYSTFCILQYSTLQYLLSSNSPRHSHHSREQCSTAQDQLLAQWEWV